ncbi:Uncharacterised protein [uncultured archaeon]|nr:Uncharacterised protein [uncultured archaeon]
MNVTLKEILGIYIEILSFFECSKCGKCCRMNPPTLYPDEVQYFSENVIIKHDGRVSLRKPCPFFIDNTCKIHDWSEPQKVYNQLRNYPT